MDMIGYIKKFGNDSFDDYPLNEIDSMILCQLTYFDFSNTPVCNTDLNYTLKEFLNNDYQKTRVKGIWNPKKNDLFARVLKSARRYYSMHIGFYSSIIDKETEKQFSACTFQLSSGLYYICYRGTDASFVGWKEDFNLGYLENIPSQIMAVTYFENFVRDYPGKYYIGGHSKGGNLAIYAGVMCKQDYQSEIITIFNHDGPGFLPDFYQKVEYGMIKEKIEKTAQNILNIRNNYPNSSLADLYDPLTMPSDLFKAHKQNDAAVMEAYGFDWRKMSEDDCVAELMKMYQELVNNKGE